VRFENQFYQLQPARKAQVAKGKVRVRRYLNGELHFWYAQRDLAYTLLPERPKAKTVIKVKTKNRRRALTIMEQYVPPTNHAWRSFSFGKGPPWAR
jgi:hypothetical protein